MELGPVNGGWQPEPEVAKNANDGRETWYREPRLTGRVGRDHMRLM